MAVHYSTPVNPLKAEVSNVLAERQSARMSEIKNVGLTWMALNTSKCNHLTPLRFKGFKLQLPRVTENVYRRPTIKMYIFYGRQLESQETDRQTDRQTDEPSENWSVAGALLLCNVKFLYYIILLCYCCSCVNER